MQLRDYQQALIDAAREQFRAGHRRVLIVAPCGAGKTVLSAFMCSQHVARGGKVLYLAHRRELLWQAARTFERAGLGQPMQGRGAEIMVGSGIRVMSVQTAARRTAADDVTMIMVDECHHIAAATYQKVIAAHSGALLVGLTATPIRLDGRGLGETFDAMVGGLTAQWLIENGYLAPYRYFAAPTVDTSGARKAHGEYVPGDIEQMLLDREGVIAGDVIAQYRTHADGMKAICYCPTVNASQRFAARFCEAGIPARHIDGAMSEAARDEAIEDFRAGRVRVICNVDIVGEGFDVPDCECTIMLRPTTSLSLYIQQAMRCMRYAPGKRALIFDHVSNFLRHGAPDMDREWALDGEKKRAENKVKVRACPECFAVLPAGTKECPECGYVFTPAGKPRTEAEERADALISEISAAEFKRLERLRREEAEAVRRREERKEEAEARSADDFYAIAKRRGYKPGWAYYRAKARGYI